MSPVSVSFPNPAPREATRPLRAPMLRGMRRGGQGRVSALAGCITFLVAGCSSPAAESSPTVLRATKVPENVTPSSAAATNSPQIEKRQAVAAVRAYYAEIGSAASSGDTSRLVRLSTPDCPCRALVSFIDGKYETGSIRGFSYTLHSLRVDRHDQGSVLVSVHYSIPAVEELDKRGSVITRIDAVPPSQKAVLVSMVNGEWLVHNVTNFEP